MKYSLIFFSFFFLVACQKDQSPEVDSEDLSSIVHSPNAYLLKNPEFFPEMLIPASNPLTEEGILLGRFLFYDPILSSDSTLSCASCHLQNMGFTDQLAVSKGVTGIFGQRSAMSLINIGYANNGLFWDGRTKSLEAQALHPVEDPTEMNESWANVESKLQEHSTYPKMFREAFPILKKSEITRDLVAKALAQFERTLISGNAPYDRAVHPDHTYTMTQAELDGYLLFFAEVSDEHPGCHHCHSAPIFGGNEYFNNGLDGVTDLNDFPDLGRGLVTGNVFDNGKFKAPSLRNIELTAPYMHDGRFQTLEEVIDHYASGGHFSDNLDSNISGFELNEGEKSALVAFLKALTDEEFINNPAFSNPFDENRSIKKELRSLMTLALFLAIIALNG